MILKDPSNKHLRKHSTPSLQEASIRSALSSFARAVSQASSCISQTPDQVFPQVYNRLRFDAGQNEGLNERLELLMDLGPHIRRKGADHA